LAPMPWTSPQMVSRGLSGTASAAAAVAVAQSALGQRDRPRHYATVAEARLACSGVSNPRGAQSQAAFAQNAFAAKPSGSSQGSFGFDPSSGKFAGIKANSPESSDQPLPGLGLMPVTFQSCTAASSSKCRVLCYGDSLTAGFCDQGRQFEPYGRTLAKVLGAVLGPCEVLVCGHSGHRASEMAADLDNPAVLDRVGQVGKGLRHCLADPAQRPDLVLIMAGTNDLGGGLRPQTVMEDIAKLHAVCHQHGVPTVAIAPPPLRDGRIEASRRQLADLLSAWAKTVPSVQAVIEPSEMIPVSAAGAWDVDGLHFSPDGSRLLGHQLAMKVFPCLLAIKQAKQPEIPRS